MHPLAGWLLRKCCSIGGVGSVFMVVLMLSARTQGASLSMRSGDRTASSQARRDVSRLYDRLPLNFEQSRTRIGGAAAFTARGPDFSLLLTSAGARLRLGPNGSDELGFQLLDANPQSRLAPRRLQAGKTNYLVGDDPAAWQRDNPTYGQIAYEAVYPGIDLVFQGHGRQLEYDFVVAPGASPERIRLYLQGADNLEQQADGSLVFCVGSMQVSMHRPIIYQERDGRRHEIEGAFLLSSDGCGLGFTIGAYDRTRTLVIDPVLSYSTFLGGGTPSDLTRDVAYGVAVDAQGNTYITGMTQSDDFPTQAALQDTFVGRGGPNGGLFLGDIFVTKLNPAGTEVIYSTYIGGTLDEGAYGIAVDAQGNACVAGVTISDDFPTQGALQETFGGSGFRPGDAVVFKLNASGSAFIFSTYLGGVEGDLASGIAVDASDAIYVTGTTSSAGFPRTPGAYAQAGNFDQFFITKIESDGSSLIYSSVFGFGSLGAAPRIAVDGDGQACITGGTTALDFPVINAFQPARAGVFSSPDAFVSKLNAAGSALVFSTYLGGSGDENLTVTTDVPGGICCDNEGNIFVTGSTKSVDFPSTDGVFQSIYQGGTTDAFLAKFSPAGELRFSTLLGGDGADAGFAVGLGPDANVYVAGVSASSNFPVTLDALQSSNSSGFNRAFFSVLTPEATAPVFSTYFGGTSGFDEAFAMAVSRTGDAFLVGGTFSCDFTTTADAFQPDSPQCPTGTSFSDAFVARISLGDPHPTISRVWPNTHGNRGTVAVTLSGRLFVEGAGVRLKRSGESDVVAEDVIVEASGEAVQLRFDLTDVAVGAWDVVLTNLDGSSATAVSGFTVETVVEARIRADMVGHQAVRGGRPQTFYLMVGNDGNIDAYGVPVLVSIPDFMQYAFRFELATPAQPDEGPPIDFDQVSKDVHDAGRINVWLLVPLVKASEPTALPISFTAPDDFEFGHTEFDIEVYAGTPWFRFKDQASAGKSVGARSAAGIHFPPIEINPDCVASMITLAMNAAGYFPGVGCVTSALNALGGTLVAGFSGVGSTPGFIRPMSGNDAAVAAMQTVTGCLAGVNPGFAVLNVIAQSMTLPKNWDQFVKDCWPAYQRWTGRIVVSGDPNDKVGPLGAGDGHYIRGTESLQYAIFFENMENASAPAQLVAITDQLDADTLDLSSLSLGLISFGEHVVIPPPGLTSYTTQVDLRPERNEVVHINAELDAQSGALTWSLQSIDPDTGEPPEDPLAGFLPPNVNPPEGDGSVLFTVKARADLATGTAISNHATIVFDTNDPIETPVWTNTVDRTAPESRVSPLTDIQDAVQFEVAWSGADNGAGVAAYDIYVSVDGGDYLIWQSATTATSAVYSGESGRTYAFYSRARDLTGLIEAAPDEPDATTLVSGPDAGVDGCGAGAPGCGGTGLVTMVLAVTGLVAMRRGPRSAAN